MFLTVFGLILLAIPFLLVFYFKNRFLGFVYVLGSVIAAHLIIAFVTQFFHIFYYSVIITIHSIIALGVLAVIKYKFKILPFKFKINWWVVIGFLIIFFELWSVHFLYTGQLNTISGPIQISANYYPYPYFSDEWIGVAFSNYLIHNNELPFINPLTLNSSHILFSNIFICFFSLISEIFLMLSVSPLFGYTILTLISGLLICFLIFIFLRTRGVNYFIALMATLLVPYIVNGTNIPGLWYFIPFTGGLITFLISLIGFSKQKNVFALLASLLSILLYPPLIVFVLPLFIIYLLTTAELKNSQKIKILLVSLLSISLGAVLISYSQKYDYNIYTLINIAKTSVWRLSLDNGIPSFYFWNIMPIIVLPFSIVGLITIFNKKNLALLVLAIIGLLLWIFYSFSSYYFFIDYARVVVLTSFLLIILAGLGLDWLIKTGARKYLPNFNKQMVLAIKILVMLVFLVMSFSYTDSSRWKELTLKTNNTDDVFVSPVAPANKYLTEEDLSLFKGISQKTFLSIPWKGLVIGAATGNFPLNSKTSIVSNNFLNYNNFMRQSCDDKKIISKNANLDYVYSTSFNCEKFIEIGSSSEGLYLYKFIK